MSQKLPVGDVLNEAVQFGLHRWATVLRFAWLPMLLSGLVFGILFALIIDPSNFSAATENATLETVKADLRIPVSAAVTLGMLVYIFVIFLFCGVMASMFRLVALGEERPGIFQLRMDGPAIRVFFAYLILMIINVAIWAGAFIVALGMTGDSWAGVFKGFGDFMTLAATAEQGNESDAQAALMALMPAMKAFGTAALIALIPLIYVNIKLTPFPAGSASENRLLLFGSFAMTFGHFWSILGISILSVLFLFLLGIVFQLALAVFQVIVALLATMGAGAAVIGAVLGVGIAAVSIFFQLFLFAFQTAIQGIIYRRLRTGE
jgi:hypothetical protein